MSDGTKYLHRHVTLCVTALKTKSHCFGGIIGPTMAILGLFERDSHVEFIYHIFGTSVKTPLCHFHRSRHVLLSFGMRLESSPSESLK